MELKKFAPGELRTALLDQLQGILDQVSLDQAALKTQSSRPACQNVCASCFSCCTARGLTSHKVTEMEFALLDERVGIPQTEAFRRYIARERQDGAYVHETCPNYDHRIGGCGVYPYRPFACRTFGYHRPEGTSFPTGCHFQGREKVFQRQDYYRDVPGAVAMRSLAREFQMCQPPQPAHYVDIDTPGAAAQGTGPTENLDGNDPIDRCFLLQKEGRLDEALTQLLQIRESQEAAEPSLYLDYCLAMLLTRLQAHEPALAVYGSLLLRLPERTDLHYYAAYHALHLGQRELARDHFKKTVTALPRHSLALGFLGYMALQEGRPADAHGLLRRAVEADPQNPYFRLRLGSLGLSQGEEGRSESRRHLEAALAHPATAEQAQAALLALQRDDGALLTTKSC